MREYVEDLIERGDLGVGEQLENCSYRKTRVSEPRSASNIPMLPVYRRGDVQADRALREYDNLAELVGGFGKW